MSLSSKRIFVCGINQESNSFNCGFSTFKDYLIKIGEEMANAENCTQLNGALTAMREEDMTPVFGVYYQAGSGAPVAKELMDEFYAGLNEKLDAADEIDGVVIVFHGATTSQTSDDVCGEVSEYIRGRVGQAVPITASFDLHANITEKIAKNVNFICGYQQYPHLDIFETGYRSVKMLAEFYKDRRVKTYRASVPVIAPASAYTTQTTALKRLMNCGKAFVKAGKLLDFSIFQVQPWLDAVEMSSAVIVIGKNGDELQEIAKELAFGEFSIREELQGAPLMQVEEILELAMKNKTGKPVVISDAADSPNAGAAGDSAFVLEKMLPYKDELRMAVSVNDEEAVKQAFELGVGGVGDFVVGASVCPKLSKPVTVKNATVKCLSDGDFIRCGPQQRGVVCNMGKTALIQTGKLYIVLCCAGKYEGDLGFYRLVGVEPALMDVVDVKACTSFRASYEPIAAAIYNAETPGAASPVLKLLPYEKRPKPLYPFEEISLDTVSQPKAYR